MWQLFIASFCDQTEIEGNGRQQTNMTNAKKLKQQALLKLKKEEARLSSSLFNKICFQIWYQKLKATTWIGISFFLWVYILIPRKCPHKTQFQHIVGGTVLSFWDKGGNLLQVYAYVDWVFDYFYWICTNFNEGIRRSVS